MIQKVLDFINSDEEMQRRQRLILSLITLVKWLFFSSIIGIIIGLVGALFHILLNLATTFRKEHDFMIFLLPIAGLIIIALYHLCGYKKSRGTNLVISAIQENDHIPFKMAPLIIISTFLTHLCGGSAGREGAALQVGGSIGNTIANLFKFDEKDTRIMIMCGMSACFGALFGTPVAAAIFSMEVISVGIMYYAALVPCILSALIGSSTSSMFGIGATKFTIGALPQFTAFNVGKIILLACIFAIVSIILCISLHSAGHLYGKYIENQYIRVFAAGLIVMALRFALNTTDYLGAGTDIIEKSFENPSAFYVFALKILFTALTLGGGFKGGEIVPTMFVGATVGSAFSVLFGLPVGLCAACGLVTVFCGVTNCPLTSLIIAIEMFGADSMKFIAISIAIGYLLSGYYSLYNSQKIVYSKYKTEYINRKSQ